MRLRARDTDTDPSRARDVAAGAAFMAIFWGISVGLYRDQAWTGPVWRMCRAASGRDWMLNSGVFRLQWRKSRGGPAARHACSFPAPAPMAPPSR